jgi:hypothetical protein
VNRRTDNLGQRFRRIRGPAVVSDPCHEAQIRPLQGAALTSESASDLLSLSLKADNGIRPDLAAVKAHAITT